jgi:hypothetical protein
MTAEAFTAESAAAASPFRKDLPRNLELRQL